MFMDRGLGAAFARFDKDSLQILCGIFILSLVVQHEMWSPHIIRTSNAIQTNITRLLKYNYKLYGPNLNQEQQGLPTTSGKDHSHLFSAQLRWGPYRPVY